MRFLLVRPNDDRAFRMHGGFRENRWISSIRPKRTEVDLGLLYISGALEQHGHTTRLCDMQIEKNPDIFFSKILRDFDPDVVGITAQTAYIFESSRIASKVKEESNAVTVVGGHHPSALPEKTLEQFDAFDYAVVGEGENTLCELALAINGDMEIKNVSGIAYRDGKRIIQNELRLPITDLDSLPFPDRGKIDPARYLPSLNDYIRLPATNLLGTRGCPYNCSFCSRTGTRTSRKVRARSAVNIFDEVVECKTRFGINDFWLVDDTFSFNRKRVMEFCELLLRHGIKDNWACYACPHEVDLTMLQRMKRAGCFLIKYGVESGNAETLKQMGKTFSLSQAIDAIAWTRKAGIEVFGGFVVGMPGETGQDIDRTIDFAIRTSPDICSFASLALFPGSDLFEKLQNEGKIRHYDWDRYLDTGSDIYKGQLPGSVMEKKVREGFRRFYLRPSYVVQKMKRIIFSGHPLREIRNIVMGFIDMF